MDQSIRRAALGAAFLTLAACGGAPEAATPIPTPGVNVSISPTSVSLARSTSQAFAAAVSGTANASVTWSVQEGSAGGAITSAGLYSAPSTTGTYHVVATSQADATKSAVATVTVEATSAAWRPFSSTSVLLAPTPRMSANDAPPSRRPRWTG